MEETKLDESSISTDLFFDALDSFPSPESDETLSSPHQLHLQIGESPVEEIRTKPHTITTPPAVSLRRRRSSSRSSTPRSLPSGNSMESFSDFLDGITPRDRRSKVPIALEDQTRGRVGSDQMSSVTEQNREISSREVVAPGDVGRTPASGVLVFVAGLVIKALGFHISLLIRSVTLPVWLLCSFFQLVTDPFRTLNHARDHASASLVWACGASRERIASLISDRQSSLQGVGKLTWRLAWGCLWSFYVCSVLFGCLLTAFLVGRLLMQFVLEEPLQIVEDLSFDYTKASPVALVPISSCSTVACGSACVVKSGVGKYRGGRFIWPNQKLQLTISVVLPESDYNQKLGIFQVKTELVASDGRVTTSSSRPCMLRYKSSPIRYLETFFKSGPLLTGYSSESQVLTLKMTGITEGPESTACIRVILEQRAEYRPGAGIPEIYAAFLKLESELPLFKRIIWNWRKTVFVWTSMGLFSFELLIVMVCCTSIIIPRERPRDITNSRP